MNMIAASLLVIVGLVCLATGLFAVTHNSLPVGVFLLAIAAMCLGRVWRMRQA